MITTCQRLAFLGLTAILLNNHVIAQEENKNTTTTTTTTNSVIGDGIEDEEAPELIVDKWFQLPEGKESISIKDYKDKVLIMLFFQAAGKGNDMALPKLKELHELYKDNDKVKFLLIQTALDRHLNDNSPDKLQGVAKKHGFTFPLGHYNYTPNFPGMVTKSGKYKNTHIPWFVVVNPQGIVKFNGVPYLIDVKFAKEKIDAMIK